MKRATICAVMAVLTASVALAADPGELIRTAQAKTDGALVLVRIKIDLGQGEQEIGGPGMAITPEGIVLTLAIDAAVPAESIRSIELVLPGNENVIPADLVGVDPVTGLGFVQAKSGQPWNVIGFQPSSEVKLGDAVVSAGLSAQDPAVPTTFGVAWVNGWRRAPARLYTVTGGQLSGVGSVVLNEAGQAIGLIGPQPFARFKLMTGQGSTVVLLQDESHSSAFLPVEEFIHVLTEGIPQGVRRVPWIGVGQITPLRKELAEAKGIDRPAVMIDQVVPGQVGDKAGLKNRDIIISLNGQPLEKLATPDLTANQFLRTLMQHKAGQTVRLGLLRNGQEVSVNVRLEAMPQMASEAKRAFNRSLGLALRETVLLDRVAGSGPSIGSRDGLIVADLTPRGPAAVAGLQRGDLVTGIDGKPVQTVADAKAALDAAMGDGTDPKPIRTQVLRNDAETTITILPPRVAGP